MLTDSNPIAAMIRSRVSLSLTTFIACFLCAASAQSENLADYFSNCRRNDSTFDNCVKDGLNAVRHLFKTGVPKYNIGPFDPFFASEVPQKVGGRFFNYKLVLKNVFESGWTVSQVTRFRSDFNKNMIQYTQFFPDKRLNGEYDFVATIFGNRYANKGPWNLTLFDFVQTTTVTRKPRIASNATLVYDTPLKVNVEVQSCKDLELHIGHLLQGRTVIENIADRIINGAWQPGFVILKPIINDLVSTAFTEIFNKNFRYFPFNEIFP